MKKKVIFGLGNYGKVFLNTRHNTGSEILEKIVFENEKKQKKNFKLSEKWEIIEEKIEGKEVLFVKLKCFINNSGFYVKDFMKKFSLNNEDILIIYDDLSMEIGKVKFKKNGSSGGHNGIKNIIEELNREDFCRIKIGIGRGDKNEDLKKRVLEKFKKEEKQEIENKIPEITKILFNWLKGMYN